MIRSVIILMICFNYCIVKCINIWKFCIAQWNSIFQTTDALRHRIIHGKKMNLKCKVDQCSSMQNSTKGSLTYFQTPSCNWPLRNYYWWKRFPSLVVQWLRIRLPMQGTRVWALVREDPTCRRATKPVCHNYWACALEPASPNYWACEPQLLKPVHLEPELCNKEKPPQWEAHAPQWSVVPACHN